MDHLDTLENRSIYVIREAYYRFRNMAVLWSAGKDSTTLLWLIRKAFFGRIPFPVVHIDTGYKFHEIYEFRERLSREWQFDFLVARNEDQIRLGIGPDNVQKMTCCTELKTNALKNLMEKQRFRAILLGIRRDEHGIRAKERYFSPRDDQFRWNYEDQAAELWDQYRWILEEREHYRIHPILHFSELDIWEYIKREEIPTIPLYFSVGNRRYRSIGCVPCCSPVVSAAATVDEIIQELRTSTRSERSGRAQDKESAYTMQKLRALGYM